jgi:hypothetical protein
MDKNFINIDDLVRQRLEGGEERERSGAWSNMRDLLDKEEQKKPIGFLYWRRIFSAVSVLVLLSAITMGGYKMSGSLNGHSNQVNKTALASATPGRNTENTPAPKAGRDNSGPLKTADNQQGSAKDGKKVKSTDRSYPKQQKSIAGTHNKTKITGNDNSNYQNNAAIATANISNTSRTSNDDAVATNRTSHSDLNTTNSTNSASVAQKKSHSVAGQSSFSASTPAMNVQTAKKQSLAVAITRQSNPTNAIVSSSVATNDKNTKSVDHHSIAKHIQKSGKTTGIAAATSTTPASHDKVAKLEHKNSSTPKVAKTPSDKVAIGNHTPAKNSSRLAGRTKSGKKTSGAGTAIAKLDKTHVKTRNTFASGTHAPTKAIGIAKVDLGKNKSAKAPIAAKTSAARNSSTGALAQVGAGGGMQKSRFVGPNVNMDNSSIEGADNAQPSPAAPKDKTVFQKLNIYYRTIKTSDKDHYQIDTESFKQISNSFAVASYDPSPRLPGTARNSSNTANSNTGANQPAPSFIGPPPPPFLGAKKVASSSVEATKGSVKEMSDNTGAQKMAEITQAFNDIKYKVGAAKFAPGLTAGINGTFFGPNSFKGFQFGVAGDFIFGDTWSILCELEYFHRINSNNFSINDQYYDANTRQVNTSVYSFPTLHSFEMPIAARFNVGNFGFSAGLNLVYSLSFTPDSTMGQPSASTKSQPVGIASGPKLNFDDFGSRFGIGYLVGMSYNVSQNLTLDMRNVQTVWDNAKSPGSKIISDQLYKSPSLQFSLIYRFGGKKGKE